MKYLLDTNICIYLLKKKYDKVSDRFSMVNKEDIGISSITLSELEFGISKSEAKEKNRRALEVLLSNLKVVPFEDKDAKVYGPLKAKLEKAGTPIGPLDTLIAAHALSQDYILVTNNEKEFKRVEGLKIENWMS